jgi:YegS/Rv2252/BmrU family lipid kinase
MIGNSNHERISTRHAGKNQRLLVVANPVSGPRGSQRAIADLLDRAGRLGVHLEVVETHPDLSAEQAVATRTGPFDCYIALGGDGTVMEVAELAMRDDIPLAIVPRGTANAVAWHFGIPFDVTRALRVAVEGRPLRIDVARTTHRGFLVMAGLGYDAHVIRDATRELKRRFGFLAYLYAALKNLGRRPYTFRVQLDEGESIRVRGGTAVITNIGSLAGNIRLVREVSPVDGRLDLLVASPAKFGHFFRMVFLGILGRLREDPRVRYYQASQIRVECRPEAPLQIDGDGIGGRHRELVAKVFPRALTLLVPPEGMLKVPWMPDVSWSPSLPKGTPADRPRSGDQSAKSI